MKYFYYQRTQLGRWSPRGSADFPQDRSPDGTRHTLSKINELPVHHQDLSLNELSQLYSREA